MTPVPDELVERAPLPFDIIDRMAMAIYDHRGSKSDWVMASAETKFRIRRSVVSLLDLFEVREVSEMNPAWQGSGFAAGDLLPDEAFTGRRQFVLTTPWEEAT